MQSKLIIIRLSLRAMLLVCLVLGTSGSSGYLRAGLWASASALRSPDLHNTPDGYPPDPKSNINASVSFVDVASLQTAFNNARNVENSQLGINIPLMTVPSQTEWNGMGNNEKAFWLMNRERLDRGVHALHGVEPNVNSVAQGYATWLLTNNQWGHNVDGLGPWTRLNNNAAIGACHDFLNVAENLSVFVSSANNISMPVEGAIYNWMYVDGTSWGHRHAILWYPYTENGGAPDKEGFLGIGLATGGPYQGPFSTLWPYAALVVMNIFDPCATWEYNVAPVGDKFLYLAVEMR